MNAELGSWICAGGLVLVGALALYRYRGKEPTTIDFGFALILGALLLFAVGLLFFQGALLRPSDGIIGG